MLIQEHFAKARGEKKHPGSSGKELLISELFESVCLPQTFSLLILSPMASKLFSNLTKALTCKLQVQSKTSKDLFHSHIWLLLDLKKRLPISSVTLFNADNGGQNLKNVEVAF